jgi:uncharacterized Zn finger protein (UPF0148 family)
MDDGGAPKQCPNCGGMLAVRKTGTVITRTCIRPSCGKTYYDVAPVERRASKKHRRRRGRKKSGPYARRRYIGTGVEVLTVKRQRELRDKIGLPPTPRREHDVIRRG